MRIKKLLGFTLIELLIVIAIIGILAVALLPSIMNAPVKSRDARRIEDLQKLQKVLINSNLEGIQYPTGYSCVTDSFLTSYLTTLGGSALKDPQSTNIVAGGGSTCTGQYFYKKSGLTNYGFGLYAHVERKESANTECDDAFNGTIVPVIDTTAASNHCYVILSPK